MPAKSQSRKPAAATPSLRISVRAQCGGAHAAFVRRQLKRAHQILKPPLSELSVALVGDRVMSDLHLRFMSIAGPTDVLTFPLENDAGGRVISGEVIICVPEGRRRAREHKTRIEHELLLYGIHGMLHLSGYDDASAKQFKMMHRVEDELLSQLGVGPVFLTARSCLARMAQHKVKTEGWCVSPARG